MSSFFRNMLFLLLFVPLLLQAQNKSSETEVYTEVLIETEASKLWTLLSKFEDYPQWHPYLKKVKGKLRKGAQLRFTTMNLDSTTGHFSAYLLDVKPNKALSWGGSLGFIFRAKHYFLIETVDAQHVKLIQGEYWKGIFGKSYGKKIYKETYQKFILMNDAVKVLLEKG